MPGSSIWLLPPRDHPLEEKFEKLIGEVAGRFGSEHGGFKPHVTLCSGVGEELLSPSPQHFLSSISLPTTPPTITLTSLSSSPSYVRKLYIRVDKPGISALALAAREALTRSAPKKEDEDKGREGEGEGKAEAEEWLEGYEPHVSLLYHDCPVVGEERIKEVEGLVKAEGVELGEEAWVGGRVVLVETWRPIGEWVVVAEREL